LHVAPTVRTVAAIPAVGLLVGAACGLALPPPHLLLLYVLISSSVAGAMFAWALRRPWCLAAAVALGFFGGGWMLSAVAWQRAWRPPLRVAFEDLARNQRAQAAAEGRRVPEDDEAFATVEGVLRSDASPTASGVSLSIDVDGLVEQAVRRPGPFGPGTVRRPGPFGPGEVTGGILVTVVGSLAAERLDDWRAGRRVRLPVMLRRPSRYLDPGVPDHERALARRGTTLVGTTKSGALVEILARGSWFDERLASVRACARRAIGAAVGRWSPRSAAIVTAIVIGDRAGLDDDVQRRLQEAGTYHVIAISGGNIAILAGLLLGAFRTVGWLGRGAMLSAIALLTVYAMLVGGGASVDRATLMAVVYFIGRAVDHRSPPLNSLAVVAGLLVAADPLSVADPAFILTCGATLAILLVVPAVTRWNAEFAEHAEKPTSATSSALHAVRRVALPMFAASVAAEALLFPVGAIVFSRVTFAGLGLNFVAIPLMGVAQVAGMAVVPLAALWDPLALAPGWIAHAGAAGLVGSADLVRFAPMLAYRVAPPSIAAVTIYYAAAIVWWIAARWVVAGRLRAEGASASRAAAAIAVAAALWILVDPRAAVAGRGDGRLHVTFIDVGQGDAALVRFPGGSTLLVDAGGLSSASAFDIGDRVVAPVIRDAGVARLDEVVLTHGDPDHIGGAPAIVHEFRPREVWEGIPVPRFEPMNVLRAAAQAGGATWATVYRGARRVVDGVEVIARHPAIEDWERQKVRNDDSIVLELRWGDDVSVLLTGDIGKAVEREIAPLIPPARLRILKVPHHGSLTSSSAEFLAAIHPQVAVVSAGRSNHFGHPAPEVLDRYRAIGAAIFRTDQDGAVTVDTDGKTVDVHTFLGRRLGLSERR
jgi:competence protein ComEC